MRMLTASPKRALHFDCPCTPGAGIGVLLSRADMSRTERFAAFSCLARFWRPRRGAARLAGSCSHGSRYANPLGLPPAIGVVNGSCSTEPSARSNMAVIDFQHFAKRAARNPAYSERLSAQDERNLRRVIWQISDQHRQSQAWSFATWAALRKACDTPAPMPFSVGDIPTLTVELRRLWRLSNELYSAHAAADAAVLQRILRRAEAPAPILAGLCADLAAAGQREVGALNAVLADWEERELARFAERSDQCQCEHSGEPTRAVELES